MVIPVGRRGSLAGPRERAGPQQRKNYRWKASCSETAASGEEGIERRDTESDREETKATPGKGESGAAPRKARVDKQTLSLTTRRGQRLERRSGGLPVADKVQEAGR